MLKKFKGNLYKYHVRGITLITTEEEFRNLREELGTETYEKEWFCEAWQLEGENTDELVEPGC